MTGDGQDLAQAQRAHWQNTYSAHPNMYGEEVSTPAVYAAAAFRAAGARDVIELGAGHGRDALYFTREGFTVQATDFSATALEQLRRGALAQNTAAPWACGEPSPRCFRRPGTKGAGFTKPEM
ncbi:hypothetical protein ACFYXW_12295 [Streptomyces sp. NPDC001981]|uniref:hypothetical protein n=1 Tax=Streptomyces sp. NPDC001981 TaxID=3364628 RepID=UPI0036ABB890